MPPARWSAPSSRRSSWASTGWPGISAARRSAIRTTRTENRRPGEDSGPNVIPGTYNVVVKYGGHEAKGTLRVEADPALESSPADWQAWDAAINRAGGYQNAVADAINRIAATRKDVSLVLAKLDAQDKERERDGASQRRRRRGQGAAAVGAGPSEEALDGRAASLRVAGRQGPGQGRDHRPRARSRTRGAPSPPPGRRRAPRRTPTSTRPTGPCGRPSPTSTSSTPRTSPPSSARWPTPKSACSSDQGPIESSSRSCRK